ncbi:MAG TPA: hypothetical protein VGF69_15795 [Thermoanaerobaculia bacterium]
MTDVAFSEHDAEFVGRLATAMGGTAETVLVLFYPWLPAAWDERRQSGWTTLGSRTFMRRGFFGRKEERQWISGFAHTQEKLIELIYWIWTLPGRDTAVFIPDGCGKWAEAMSLLEDDREDDGSNERRMIEWFHTVLSRGERAEYLRVLSRQCSEMEMRRLVGEATAGVHVRDR